MAMGARQQWAGILVLIAALLVIGAPPGHTDRGGHGYRGHGSGDHGYRGHGHRGWHRSRGARAFISPSLIVPFGAYWGPRWEPYNDPPVVIAPSPRIYVQPSPVVEPPPVYWYYCDASQAYDPYVPQCPDGWRPVPPTPPETAPAHARGLTWVEAEGRVTHDGQRVRRAPARGLSGITPDTCGSISVARGWTRGGTSLHSPREQRGRCQTQQSVIQTGCIPHRMNMVG